MHYVIQQKLTKAEDRLTCSKKLSEKISLFKDKGKLT
jgi:hypothetical protein